MTRSHRSGVSPATGLSTRKGFLAIADHLLPMCKRCDQPATVLMYHLQNLADIEGKHGRNESDAAAAEFAHLLLASFRDSDIVARICIDVFCVFLSGTDLDGADPARMRLEEQLGARNREPDLPYMLEIDTHAIAFKEGRHGDAAALLNDGEIRIMEARKEHEAEVAAAGKVAALEGFGKKSEEKILAAGGTVVRLDARGQELTGDAGDSALAGLGTQVGTVLGSAAAFASGLVLGIVLLYYLLKDGHRVAFNTIFAEEGLGVEWDVETYGEKLKIAGGKDFDADTGEQKVAGKKIVLDEERARRIASDSKPSAGLPGTVWKRQSSSPVSAS